MKKKLLIVLPHIGSAGGGVSEAARTITDSLYARNEFDIHVLTLNTDADLSARTNWPNVTFHHYASFGPNNYGYSPGMVKHIMQHEYDVIHVHGIWTFHVFVAGLAMFRKGVPVIISPHGMLEPWILGRSRLLKAAVMALYQKKVLQHSSAIHALTPKEEQDIRDVLPNANIVTIPNYVKEEMLPERIRPNWFKSSFENKKIFIFFGRIHDKKGWRPLIAAWRNLCTDNIQFKTESVLVFCGWNDGVDDFEFAIETVKKEVGNVIYAGPQYGQDRLASYHAADFFVLPSKSEGLPMAALEAIKNNVVAMISNECNLPTLLNIGAAINIGQSEDEITQGLKYAFALTHNEINSIRSLASSHIDLHYSEEKVINALSNILNKAANKRE